jgi:hypothetical protein
MIKHRRLQKKATPEQRIGFFIKPLLTVYHHTESLKTATKAHRKRFRVKPNQKLHSLPLAYFHQITAFPC